MLHFEREAIGHDLICTMLDLFDHVILSLNDEDRWPYAVPIIFGYEATDEALVVYTYFMKAGKRLDLMPADDAYA